MKDIPCNQCGEDIEVGYSDGDIFVCNNCHDEE